MYLKSLELHGFKSFPNRTILTFEEGATVIVGPNGSGKSNISDAMRWVLGELSSRNIRGTKMTDVIFGGTEARRPMGFAEVTVVFDNSDKENRLESDYDEVSVTRRYYRTGESEYLINKEPKRLRDIYELFMNTGVGREGYSIIGQGKIAEIISKKSDERRNIFEEAAGIAKYRNRKEESERKLKSTQENLDRVRDILLEKESRLGPLEKDAEKARRGLAVMEEKKMADVSLWLFDTKKIRLDIEEATKAFKLSKNELEIIDGVIADLEAQSDTLYNKSQENKIRSQQVYDDIQEANRRLHQLDAAMDVQNTELAHNLEMIEQCKIRMGDLSRQQMGLEQQGAEYERRIEAFSVTLKKHMDIRLEYLAEQDKLQKAIQTMKKELEEALDELTVEENTAGDLNVRINVLSNSKISDGTRSKDIEEQIAQYEKEGEVLTAEAEKCEANASGFKQKIAEKDAVLNEGNARLEEISEQKESHLSVLNDLIPKSEALLHKADALQRMNESFEGFYESVKFVMRKYKEGEIRGAGKIHGPLSSLIHVDERYITAIDTALGSSLQNIVVDNEETAKAAIYALKHANAGRATFYPITAIKSATETDEIRMTKSMPGYVGRGDELVNFEPCYRSIIEWLLLRVVVFDTIDNASAAAKRIRYRVKLVTLDGQVINAGGAFTGGSAKRDSGLLSRTSEIAELREAAAGYNHTIAEKKKAIAALDAERAAVAERVKDASQEKELLLTLSRSQFAALDTANANLTANRNMIEKLRFDYHNLEGQQSKAEEELRALNVQYAAACERAEGLRAFREKRAAEMGVLDEKNDEIAAKAASEYVSIVETNKDIDGARQLLDSLKERLSELEEEKAAQRARIDELSDKSQNMDKTKALRREEHDALEEQIALLEKNRKELESGSDTYDKAMNDLRALIREKTASRESFMEASLRAENHLLRLEENRDKLGSVLWDDYNLTYEQAVALNYPPVTEENRAEIAQNQTSLRQRLRAIGHFDPSSIQQYADEKSAYDALNTQYVDLTKSHDELIAIIARLETDMRESFVKAFEDINRHFGTTFKELFGGGSASLSLTEPEDVLTSGIEITAQPPGKAVGSMSLLSGGEQSFVAIALLFAILKVNPSPFCILDEIEAALDEVNVFRFGEYIKKMSKDTQFILITHRRGTMEIGDRLYGVTMPQRGISQAIELNVNEIEGKQKEILDGVL